MKIIEKYRLNFNSFEEVLLFMQIFFLITILPLLIELLTVTCLMKTLTPGTKNFNSELNRQELKNKIVKYTDYILSKNFWVYRGTCLNRSLTLYHFFRRLGIDIQICFGIRYKKNFYNTMGKQKIEGHAWLIHNGDFFLESNSEMTRTYKMTYCFPKDNENNGKQRQYTRS